MTASEILKIAAADIGYTESPPNSNRTKYGKWYGMDGQPWCMMAVQYWFDQAGAPLPYKTASCSALERWYRNNKSDSVYDDAKPGDIAIYNFGHTGIVESATGTTITAIEGNTSPGEEGSQDNGGGVYRRTRKKSLVTAFLRPDYEEEDDNMSYEKWKEYMEQYREELRGKEGSNWSKNDRDWAVKNGIVQGDENDRYMWQDFVTREQMATMMHRIHE